MSAPSTTAIRLCVAAELIEGAPQRVTGGGRSLIVLRHHGQPRAFINSCPHLGIELDWLPGQFLDHSGHYLQCSTHGARFQLSDGLCVAGPCRGRALDEVAVTERDGWVWATPAAGT